MLKPTEAFMVEFGLDFNQDCLLLVTKYDHFQPLCRWCPKNFFGRLKLPDPSNEPSPECQ